MESYLHYLNIPQPQSNNRLDILRENDTGKTSWYLRYQVTDNLPTLRLVTTLSRLCIMYGDLDWLFLALITIKGIHSDLDVIVAVRFLANY